MTIPAPEIRDLRFFPDDEIPRDWHGGGSGVTRFFDNLSLFFPAGERFFVRSVRAHLAAVNDPALLAAVRAFSGQEGIHGREHARYNAMLRAHYPAEEMEKRVEALLRFVEKRAPKRWQLAATCALEHFTSLLAHFVLDDPRMLEGANATMAALWRWHAAEENEHKAIPFDVYLAAGGNDAERCFVMVIATVIFWAKVAEHQARLMRTDGTLLSATEWRRLLGFLFVEPGGLTRLVPLYLAYFRPGFHPDDIDARELLERWKREEGRGERAAAE